MSETPQCFDVVIAGGGPAGLAAGLFTARYRLSTLIFDRGKSLLRQCAYLDNFLGFPGGIEVGEFLGLCRAHAVEAGCRIVQQRVIALRHASEGGCRFAVETGDGMVVLARHFIAATGADASYLHGLPAPQLFDAEGDVLPELLDRHGRTPIEGLYVAGPLAGVENQALISAGQAAQLALGLVSDIRRARDGFWDALARHLDWQIKQGVYDTERYAERVHDYFTESLPEAGTPDDAEVARRRALIERWIEKKRQQQLGPSEVERRKQRGRRMRAELAQAAAVELPRPARTP